jgi:hypothetical protein
MLYQLNFKVSRFLNEFSDFETNYTPSYRHPPIIGTQNEMKEIGLYHEIKKCNLFKKCNPNERPQILNEYESRNIDMPSNREYVRQFFLHAIAEQYNQEESEKSNIYKSELDFLDEKDLASDDLDLKKTRNNPGLLNLDKNDSEEAGSLDTRTELDQKIKSLDKTSTFKPDFGIVNTNKLKEIGNDKNYIHYRTQQNNKTYDKEPTLYYYKRF